MEEMGTSISYEESYIERIRQLVERGYRLSTKNSQRLLDRIDTLEREKLMLLNSKEVTLNVPPLPESLVVDVLLKQVQDLQVQLSMYAYGRNS